MGKPYECDLLTGNFWHQTMGFLAYPTAIFADKPHVHCMLHMLPLRSHRKIVWDNIYIYLFHLHNQHHVQCTTCMSMDGKGGYMSHLLTYIIYCQPQVNKPLGCLLGGEPLQQQITRHYWKAPLQLINQGSLFRGWHYNMYMNIAEQTNMFA